MRLLIHNDRTDTIELLLEPDGWSFEMPSGARWELRAKAQVDPVEIVNRDKFLEIWLADGGDAWVYDNGQRLEPT